MDKIIKCKYCGGTDMEEWGIIRDGDRRKEKITYRCRDCNKTITTKEHNY